MSLPRKDNLLHTYGDYLTWPDDLRYELIDGAAYLMAPPAPDVAHQDVVGEIYRQIANVLERNHCRAFVAPVDVLLPKTDEADEQVDTVVQPDVLVVCDPTKLGRRRIRGAPDWVLEVLSPSTAGHDHVKKRRVYERAGVTEYWLLHPGDRLLTIYYLENGAYGKPAVQELTGETTLHVLPQVTIAWDDLVERLPAPDY